MKQSKKLNWLLAIILLVGSPFPSFSQTVKDFFNDNGASLTYLGIDYYQARLINDPGTNNTDDIKNRLYGSMNDVVINEPKSYDIAGAFKKNVNNDLTAVTSRNEKIKAGDITSSNSGDFNRLTDSDIAAEVKSLSLKDKTGYGLVFIMEGMRKEGKKSEGSVWVTIIDMKTKKVLMTERMEQEAAGFGFRNFWVSIIKRSIVEISKKKYKSWKSKYGS